MTNWEDLRDAAIVAYEESRGEPPAWTHLHMFQIHTLLETPLGKQLTEARFTEQFRRFLASTDKFAPIRAGSIKYFCDHFGEFGPERGAAPVPQAKPATCGRCGDSRFIDGPRVVGRASRSEPCPECNGK